MLKHKGVTFDFGNGRIYVIPPLSMSNFLRLRSKLKVVEKAVKEDWTVVADACIDVVCEAMQRNYPDLTRDDVADLIDLGNIQDAVLCAADVGGYYRKLREDQLKQAQSKEGVNV